VGKRADALKSVARRPIVIESQTDFSGLMLQFLPRQVAEQSYRWTLTSIQR
jgi:hypothetical protein